MKNPGSPPGNGHKILFWFKLKSNSTFMDESEQQKNF